MSLWHTILLAIIEGLTEFLPISSTGHMIIVSSLMGISQFEFTGTFITSIQFGAILSVVFLYWRRFLQSFDFYLKLFVGFLPFGVAGFLLKDYIEELLKSVTVVAVMLILGGIVLLFIDKYFIRQEHQPDSQPNFKQALFIGLFQCFALLPGISRSAATMIGAMTQGFNRKSAAEFSFLLAVPTMFVITAYQMLKSYKTIKPADMDMLLLGNAISFVVAILAIKFFVGFLTKYGFRVFGIYRIILGAIILAFLAMGFDLNLV